MENMLYKSTQIFLAVSLLSLQALAAEPPDAGAVLNLDRSKIEQLLQERKLQQGPVKAEVDVKREATEKKASQEKNIPLKSFDVSQSLILTAQEIQAVLAPYEGRTVSLADLLDAVDGINRLYAGKNMPTARAFLPPQDVKNGVVVIRLVESRVGAIQVAGLKQLQPTFVEARMSLTSGQLMSVPTLEDDLIRFNRLNDTQLRASVKPGSQPGTTDVLLDAAEPPRFQNTLFMDNNGRETVGKYRLGLMSRINSVTGRGDNLVLSATGADGSQSYYLGYALPLQAHDMSLNVSLSQGDIDVVEGPFAPLDITGSSQEINVGLTLPIVVSRSELQNVYVKLAGKQSASEFGGFTQQDVNLSTLTLGANLLHQDDTNAWTVDTSLTQGGYWLGGQSQFVALRASGSWLGKLAARDQLLLNGALQYSEDDLLPAAEQFQLGGSSSVRGYSEGLLSGRTGFLLSLEYRHELDWPSAFKAQHPDAPQVTYLAFFDHGGAFPYRPAGQQQVVSDDYLTGVGMGLQLAWGKRANLRLTAAKPLEENANELSPRDLRFNATLSISWP